MEFVIITGISGAGKSQAIKCLEDLSYYCIDNLPPSLISDFIELSFLNRNEIKRAAFVIDIRGGEFFDDLLYSVEELKRQGKEFKVLFLEASDEVLIRRYKETRREHPMSRGGSIAEGIKEERKKLSEIRTISDYIIDTTNLKNFQLKAELAKIFSSEPAETNMTINFISFGFKNGLPLDADNVFDVRFMPNPFYLKSMKKLTGNNKKVRDYVLKWDESTEFIEKTYDLLKYLIPFYIKEGKTNLVIAFGCTGGQHRSVAVANRFYELFAKEGNRVTVLHRDLYYDRS